MSSTGQLIPKYRHPSETTFIYDNTIVADTENINTSEVRMIHVFASPKGIDNKLLEKKSLYSYIEEYGYPDYKRYGQPGYMPYASLNTGYASAWCMRVMPTDAAYANVIYVAKIKADKTDAANPKLMVKLVPFTQSGLNDGSLFETYMETLKNLTPDSDGYITYPYIGFRCLGRGSYGAYFRARMSHDVGSDKGNSYKNYSVALLSTENGTVQKESFNVCLTDDATDPNTNTTLAIADVVNDFEGDGSKRFAVEFMYDYHQAIFDFYKANVDPTTKLTAETFDIFGYDRTTASDNTHITIVDGISSVALMSTTGIGFASGDDGSLSDTADASKKENALDQLYLSAYSGGLDAKILSKVRTPCNCIIDANFSLTTKKAIASLAINRMNGMAYIDSGLLTTISQVETYFTSFADIDSYVVSKNAGMFKTQDPVTNKVIPATVSLWLASKIPNHWKNYGMYTPMAGSDYATFSGYVKNSVLPEIDSDNDDVKEIFYDQRWNYIECIAENTYVRGTQQTSYQVGGTNISDLCEESNAHVLLAVKNRLELLLAEKRYHFAEVSDQKRYQSDANELFSSWKGIYFRSFDIQFKMSKYEELRSILHCYCNIIFKTIAKRSIIEININPRA